CTITPLPRMSVPVASPRVTPCSRVSTVATPSSLAVMLSLSPPWCSPWPTRPCAVAAGLKWPPALLPSGALQSPFSCTWKPCSLPPGSPVTSPVTRMPPSTGAKLSVPATWLPSVACSRAVADTAPGAAAMPSGIAPGSASTGGAVAALASGAGVAAGSSTGACGWQAASSRAAGNSSIRAWRMGGSPLKRGSSVARISFARGDDPAGHARADRARGRAQHQQRAAEDVVVRAAAKHRAAHRHVDRGYAVGIGHDPARAVTHRAILARASERIVVAAGAARIHRAAVAALVHLQAVRAVGHQPADLAAHAHAVAGCGEQHAPADQAAGGRGEIGDRVRMGADGGDLARLGRRR